MSQKWDMTLWPWFSVCYESKMNRTIPASMRKAPSLLSFSTDSCSNLGWGMVRSLMFKAPLGFRKNNKEDDLEAGRCLFCSHLIKHNYIKWSVLQRELQKDHLTLIVQTASRNLSLLAEMLRVPHLIGQIVDTVQSRMDHQHGVGQRLVLQLTHGEDAVIQPGAGAGPEGFLQRAYISRQNCIN